MDNDFNYDRNVKGVAAVLSNMKNNSESFRDESPQNSSFDTKSADYLKGKKSTCSYV